MSKKLLYIGLNGYAGAGKDTVAKMISYILNNDKTQSMSVDKCYELFMKQFTPTDPATINNQVDIHCTCIAFADQLKYICAAMFGIDVMYFYFNKANSWICINKDFNLTMSKPDQNFIVSAEDFYIAREGYLRSEHKFYMSLRELLVYVGTYVLQDMFGKQVFINMVEKEINKKMMNQSLEYVICTDVRFLHEFDYIKSHNGIMINIVRDNVKQLENIAEHDLDGQDDFDYVIENNGDYKDLFCQVWNTLHDNIEFKNIVVQLASHDGSDNYLTLKNVEDDNHIWTLVSEYGACRICHDNGSILFVDPTGGPMIRIGDELKKLISYANYYYHDDIRFQVVKKIWYDEVTGKAMIMTHL